MSFDLPPENADLEFLPVVLQATRTADYSASSVSQNFAPVKVDIIAAAQQDGTMGAPPDMLDGAPATDPDNQIAPDPGESNPSEDQPSQSKDTTPDSGTSDVAPAPPGQDVAADAQEENDLRKEEQEADKAEAEAEREAAKDEKDAAKDAAKAEKDADKTNNGKNP